MTGLPAWIVQDVNVVTVALLAIVAVSLLQGLRRGASGSARQLFYFLLHSAVTIGAVVLSAMAAAAFSPGLRDWLAAAVPARPEPTANAVRHFVYTFETGLRDLPLLRFAVLFLFCYMVIRGVTGLFARWFAAIGSAPFAFLPSGGAVGRAAGGVIGTVLGAVRALLVTAVLFAYCALFPQAPFTDYIQQSGLYREAAALVIRPAWVGIRIGYDDEKSQSV